MSLTRRFLKDLGIEPDQIEKIIGEHSETVTALKDKIDNLEAENADMKPKADQFDDINGKYEELKKKSKETLDENYAKLKEEYDNYKSQVEAKEVLLRKSDKVKEVLKDIGVPERHYEKILKYSNIDKIELDDSGEIKDVADLKKSLEADWSDHIDHTQQHGAKTTTPPQQTGKVDLSSLSMADYIAERKKG